MSKTFDPMDLVGKRVNNLMVIAYYGFKYENVKSHGVPQQQKRHYYIVECDCGKRKIVRRAHLTSGKKTISCGCVRFVSNDPIYQPVLHNSLGMGAELYDIKN